MVYSNKSVEKDPENHLKHSEPRLDELTTSLPSKRRKPSRDDPSGSFSISPSVLALWNDVFSSPSVGGDGEGKYSNICNYIPWDSNHH